MHALVRTTFIVIHTQYIYMHLYISNPEPRSGRWIWPHHPLSRTPLAQATKRCGPSGYELNRSPPNFAANPKPREPSRTSRSSHASSDRLSPKSRRSSSRTLRCAAATPVLAKRRHHPSPRSGRVASRPVPRGGEQAHEMGGMSIQVFSTSRCIQQAKSIASYSRKGSVAADAAHVSAERPSADRSRAHPAFHVSTTPAAGPCPVVQRLIEALEAGRQSRRLGAEAATSASKDKSRCKWFLIWSFDCNPNFSTACGGINPRYHKMVHGPHRLRWPSP
jgi:hypothetical protein